jgi:uncharacterized protein (TIGR03083 family)
MTVTAVPVEEIPPLDHEEAMGLAGTEYDRFVEAVEHLTPQQWTAPTDCPHWDVRAVVGHVLGMMELDTDGAELARQITLAAQRVQSTGGARIDALTAIQVEEHAALETGELVAAIRAAAPRALAGRASLTAEERAMPYDPGPPFDGPWTRGYLVDVVHTRDPWMHRVDIARATGTDLVLTRGHDGRLVADVVADWARRHGRPFALILGGPAGGGFVAGGGGDRYELDAVEFCRIVSGRAAGDGLLGRAVPF